MRFENILILMGPPWAGKTTLCHHLRDQGYSVVSPGDDMRKAVARETSVGKRIKSIIQSGGVPAPDICISFIQDGFSQVERSCCAFDGCPRSVEEAEAMDRMFEKHDIQRLLIAQIDIRNETALHRALHSRRSDDSLRLDDAFEAVLQRLNNYRSYSDLIGKYYGQRLRHIDGDVDFEQIYARISQLLDEPIAPGVYFER